MPCVTGIEVYISTSGLKNGRQISDGLHPTSAEAAVFIHFQEYWPSQQQQCMNHKCIVIGVSTNLSSALACPPHLDIVNSETSHCWIRRPTCPPPLRFGRPEIRHCRRRIICPWLTALSVWKPAIHCSDSKINHQIERFMMIDGCQSWGKRASCKKNSSPWSKGTTLNWDWDQGSVNLRTFENCASWTSWMSLLSLLLWEWLLAGFFPLFFLPMAIFVLESDGWDAKIRIGRGGRNKVWSENEQLVVGRSGSCLLPYYYFVIEFEGSTLFSLSK